MTELPSKSQLKNVGDRLRKRTTGDLELDGEQADADLQLLTRWRAAHSGALAKTRAGLGTIVTRVLNVESPAGLVTQRLKRFESIVAKLLAGARKLEILRVRDYNLNPHPGGYRALHLWCRRDEFKVEVQIRTRRQQLWAEAVEEWDNALGLDVKHEQAPHVVLECFRLLANAAHRGDTGMAHTRTLRRSYWTRLRRR